jgi:Na+/H+ antiporter NhaD/arsenite permease-like protein
VLGFFRYYYKEEFNHPQKGLKALMRMKAEECIQNRIILKKTLIVLVGVIVLFFLHEIIHMTAAAVALLGAATLVLWVSPHKDPKSIFKKVELSVLVFFVSLFVLVG